MSYKGKSASKKAAFPAPPAVPTYRNKSAPPVQQQTPLSKSPSEKTPPSIDEVPTAVNKSSFGSFGYGKAKKGRRKGKGVTAPLDAVPPRATRSAPLRRPGGSYAQDSSPAKDLSNVVEGSDPVEVTAEELEFSFLPPQAQAEKLATQARAISERKDLEAQYRIVLGQVRMHKAEKLALRKVKTREAKRHVHAAEAFVVGNNLDRKAAVQALAAALANGDSQPWGRAKLMLVGQGRAGKTSTVRNLLGLPFENTKSTVGIDLKVTRSDNWRERNLGESDFELQAYRSAGARLLEFKESGRRDHRQLEAVSVEEEPRQDEQDSTDKRSSGTLSKLSKRLSTAFKRNSKASSSGGQKEVGNGHLTAKQQVVNLHLKSRGTTENPQVPGAKEETDAGATNISATSSSQSQGETEGVGTNENTALGKGEEAQADKGTIVPFFSDEEVAQRFDANLVIKASRESVDNVSFSIWDYGGQEVFYTLHHIFLTQYGVYLVVFDMVEALDAPDQVVSYLNFWLNSILLHAPNAPFLLIGTKLDIVSDEADHLKIDRMLRERIKLARFASLIPNRKIGFFPLNNKIGGGSALHQVRDALQSAVQGAEYVNQKVSLRWIKVLDDLLLREEAQLPLEQVRQIASERGVGDHKEVEQMLFYFHQLGVLVHLTATEQLRSHVITKPQWLLEKLATVISDAQVDGHARSAYDKELRDAGLAGDYDILRHEGIASRDLLDFLWQGEPVEFLLDVMKNMMLLSEWSFGSNAGRVASGCQFYLVPSLIPRGKLENELVGPTCFLDFSEFFLPIGIFQRLLALVADYSARFEDSAPPELCSDAASLSFGFTDFQLDVIQSQNKIRIVVDREGGGAPRAIKVLVSMLRKLKDDVMGQKLKWRLTLASSKDPRACVAYDDAIKARDAGKDKVRGLKRKVVKLADLAEFFEDDSQGSLVEDAVPASPGLSQLAASGKQLLSAAAARALPSPFAKKLESMLGSSFRYHLFLSHKQSTSADAVSTLATKLAARGLLCWYDQQERHLNRNGMESGVENSAVFMLFLSKDVFKSDYVCFELTTAVKHNKPIMLVHEADPKFCYSFCDFSEYCETCPAQFKSLFESIESLPYRRRFYEAEAMLAEIQSRVVTAITGDQPSGKAMISY